MNMSKNDISLDELKKAADVIRDFNVTKDVQSLSEVLPLVLLILRSHIKEIQKAEGKIKFYAPVWVDILINRLSNGEYPLSPDEYRMFRSQVGQLSFNDYKEAGNSLTAYSPQYLTPEEISEMVLALKHYFKFI